MPRILIIDDNNMIRATLRDILEEAGYEVEEAANGAEGLELARDRAPSLVVTDILMPDKEGIETICELREQDPNLRIVAMSGGGRSGNMDFLRIAKLRGADKALAKPFTPDDVLGLVQQLLPAPA